MPDSDFSTLFELLPIGAYRSSPDGRQLRANPALVRMDGYATEAEMLAATKDIASEWYVDPQRREQFKALLHAHGRVVDFDSEVYRHRTRERIWVRVHAHVVKDAQGNVLYYEGTVQDITAERAALRALEASERRFRALTALSSDWYWESDTEGRIRRLDINPQCTHPGIDVHVVGKTRRELGSRNLSEADWDQHEACMRERRSFQNFEIHCLTEDGSEVWHAISGEPVYENGECTGYRGVGRDVSERKKSEQAIRALAFHDPLTSLPNRRLLMDRLTQILASRSRRKLVSVLLFMDLDRFKCLNDQMGHAIGDQLLVQVAQRLCGCVRINDTVARLGGDEFIVLLEDAGSDADMACLHAGKVCDKILAALQQPHVLGEHVHQGYASIGAVVMDDAQLDAASYLRYADQAMYAAKGQGGNRYVFWHTLAA